MQHLHTPMRLLVVAMAMLALSWFPALASNSVLALQKTPRMTGMDLLMRQQAAPTAIWPWQP